MKDTTKTQQICHYIASAIVTPEGETAQAVYCPARGEHTGDVPLAAVQTADQAVAAAFPA